MKRWVMIVLAGFAVFVAWKIGLFQAAVTK